MELSVITVPRQVKPGFIITIGHLKSWILLEPQSSDIWVNACLLVSALREGIVCENGIENLTGTHLEDEISIGIKMLLNAVKTCTKVYLTF